MKFTVKQARVLADKTRTEVAKELGVAVSTYDNKEKNRTPWTVKEAYKLSEVLNTPFEDIDFLCLDRSKNETETIERSE